ncbi:MAG: hypothetical protein JOY69_05400, partial [Candidatus Eremiobacteraeota bacterium]|nr:hypothetical protein [Candidatus Eremiobacteraeota bacterium]
ALAGLVSLRALSLSNGNLRGTPPAELRLSAVELRGARVTGIDALMGHSTLRALRLRAIAGVRSIEALAHHANLRVVALEALPYLDCLEALATLPQLESLVLDGLWQFSIAEAAVVGSLHRLKHLAIDIGGRRKNVEIARRLQTTKPPPFDIRERAYDFTIS